jgi:hypothetical protein
MVVAVFVIALEAAAGPWNKLAAANEPYRVRI